MEKHIRKRLYISLVLSVLLIFSFNIYMRKNSDQVKILVARESIVEGTIIEETMVQLVSINKEARDRFLKDSVMHKHLVVGSITLKDFNKGEPFIIDNKQLSFSEYHIKQLRKNEAYKDTLLIPYNMRLVSVSVDKSGSLNRSLEKDLYVDVVFTSDTNKTGGSYSRLVLQHVEIYKIEDSGDPKKNDTQEVMLLVRPDQVSILTSAKRNGKIDLILNPIKGSTHMSVPIFTSDFANYTPVERDYEEEFKKALNFFIFNEEINNNILTTIRNNMSQKDIVESFNNIDLNQNQVDQLREILKGE